MGQYTVERRVFIARKCYETHYYAKVQRFPGKDPPDKKSIWRNVKKYEDHGTSLNRNLVNVSTWMAQIFWHEIIALHRPTEWPSRSPDLTPYDFFLWGYMKSEVYATPPLDMADLVQEINNVAYDIW